MRRWRKKTDEDEVLTFEGMEVLEDEEEPEERPRRRYVPPRPFKTRFAPDDDEDDEDDYGAPTFEDLEHKIRAGAYKPKPKDPWTAHMLYQSLRDLGEI